MHNIVYLLGRVSEEIKREEENKALLTIAVQRSVPNEEGIYLVDFIPCVLVGKIGDHTMEYCEKGDLVGIKGSIQTADNKMYIVVEKISFLSSKKVEEEGE